MKSRHIQIGVLVIIGFLVITAARSLGEPWRDRQGGPLGELTEEQRDAVHELIFDMRDDGASRDEIHAAVIELLEDWGVEIPAEMLDGPREGRGPGSGHGPGFGRGPGFGHGPHIIMDELTQDQRDAIHEMIMGMRESGGARDDIHEAVIAQLEEWGIEIPEDFPPPPGDGRHRALRELTQEQRTEIRETVREMREQGASRDEIHDAVRARLEEWGIDLPERPGGRAGKGAERSTGQRSRIQASNYPNPFNPSTDIAYALEAPSDVTIEIYNVAGQAVRTFDVGFQAAGEHSVHWDGGDASGKPVASGIYFYRIEAGDDVVTDDMILLK